MANNAVDRRLKELSRTQLEMCDIMRELRQIRDDARLEMYGTPVHVWPITERDHQLRGTGCWCDPRVERKRDAADIVIHNRAQ